jgi:hypothetical protein
MSLATNTGVLTVKAAGVNECVDKEGYSVRRAIL